MFAMLPYLNEYVCVCILGWMTSVSFYGNGTECACGILFSVRSGNETGISRGSL